jgi:isopentenyl-diphosphate Delta-isomerase
MAKVPVVNENDELIEYRERESLALEDIYRATALWITNSRGQILLAQRSFNKNHDSGKWGPAVAGTVEEGEDYESNIVKEAKEELGLIGVEFTKVKKIRRRTKYNYFSQWFSAIVDKEIDEFTIQTEEVAGIKWYNKEELIQDLSANPDKYLRGFDTYLEMFN